MGFLDHTTNNIIVDAVLTDKGRKKLASATGLTIIQYAFADPEVDYTLLKKYGEIVGKEKIEKNTPIYEASTSNEMVAEYEQNLLQDSTGNSVESITSTTQSVSPPLYNYELVFNGFDGGTTITLEVVYSSTVWELTTTVASSAPRVGDPGNFLTRAIISHTPSAPLTLEFSTQNMSWTGTKTASFSVVEQGGASTSVQNVDITLP